MKHVYTLHRRVRMLILAPILLLIPMVAAYSYSSASVLLRNTRTVTQRALDVYMSNVDEYMRSMEYYWGGLRSTGNFLSLVNENSGEEHFIVAGRLKTDLETSIETLKYIDNLWFYQAERNEYFDAIPTGNTSFDRKEAEPAIRERVRQIEAGQELDDKWQPLLWEGRFYLLRMIRVKNIYMGGCISVEHLLENMRKNGFSDLDYLTILDADGSVMGEALPFDGALLSKRLANAQSAVSAGGSRYLIAGRQFANGAFTMTALLDEAAVMGGMQMHSIVLGLGILFILVFALLFSLLMSRWVARPVARLCAKMERIKNGAWEAVDGTDVQRENCREFLLLNETFDDLIRSIRKLKIDIYEENAKRQELELRQKSTELQYMKAQMKPHFLINCLNVVNNMAIMGRTEQIGELTCCLGNQLRYVMGIGTLEPLRRELDMVENCWRIQELCHGDCLGIHLQAEESILDTQVPPLILMTFVENVAKHQAASQARVDVFIVCSRYDEGGTEKLRLEIWDTGSGYPQRVLDCLRENRPIIDEKGEHFGIRNLLARIALVYQGQEEITIGNHEESGGACADMLLPLTVTGGAL